MRALNIPLTILRMAACIRRESWQHAGRTREASVAPFVGEPRAIMLLASILFMLQDDSDAFALAGVSAIKFGEGDRSRPALGEPRNVAGFGRGAEEAAMLWSFRMLFIFDMP